MTPDWWVKCNLEESRRGLIKVLSRDFHGGTKRSPKVSVRTADVECVWNVMAHGDAREGKWRGNWRMEWVASTLTLPRNVVYRALLTLIRTPRLPAVNWTDAPADLNGLVRFGERQNLVSALLPSRFKRTIPSFFPVALRPDSGSWPPLTELRDQTHWTHHIRKDSSGRVISPTQRSLPVNTQHSQETNIHVPNGIRAHSPIEWAAANPCLDRAVTWIGSWCTYRDSNLAPECKLWTN